MNTTSRLLAGHVKVLVLVGGGAGCLASYPSLHPDAIVVFDVAGELSHYVRRCSKPSWFIPLAFSQTTASLLRFATEAFKLAVKGLPNVAADHGLAQKPVFGLLAATEFVLSAQFQRLADEIAAALTIAANGIVVSVTLEIRASLCGGTGCLASIVLADHLREALRCRLAPVVVTRFKHIGAQTYQSIGRRTQTNAAAGLVHHLGSLRTPTGTPYHVPSLSITELSPGLGQNKAARQTQVAQLFQATSCSQYERHVDELRPNWSTESAFGNVCLECVEFYFEAKPEAIAFDVAPAFESQVTRMLAIQQADFSRVEVTLVTKWRRISRPSLRRIIALFQNTEMSRDGLIAGISTPGRRLRSRARAEFSDGRQLELERIASEWSEAPRTAKNTCERLMTYKTSIESLVRLEQELMNRRDVLKATEKWQSRWLRLIGRQVKPVSLFDSLLSLMTGRDFQLSQLLKLAKKLRRTVDELRRVRSRLAAVRRALKAVRLKDRMDRRRMKGIANLLHGFGPSACQRNAKALVTAREIDAVWTTLWEFRELTRADQLRILLDAVDKVTVDGLAQVAGSKEADLTAVARTLLKNPSPNPAPYFAGKLRLDEPDVVLVLPPLAENDVEKIQHHFDGSSSNNRTKIVACDSAIAGLAIVKVSHYVVREYTDLFTERVRHDLEEAWKNKDAYGLTQDLLSLLGLRIVDGRIELPA